MSVAQARRTALAAQGFLDKPHAEPTMRTFQRTLERTGVLQVDSVNVLQRAHYMPLYSRMGPYDVDLLRRAAEQRPRRLVEYWAHVQAFMPVELWPVMQHRMDDYRAKRGKWGFVADDDELDRPTCWPSSPTAAPSTARDLDDGLPARQGQLGLELVRDPPAARLPLHVRRGRDRRAQQPVRDPLRPARAGASRPRVLAPPTPDPRGGRAASWSAGPPASHGVATVQDLRDYYRMRSTTRRARGRRPSSRTGELVPVAVAGLEAPGLPAPRRPAARAGSTPGRC